MHLHLRSYPHVPFFLFGELRGRRGPLDVGRHAELVELIRADVADALHDVNQQRVQLVQRQRPHLRRSRSEKALTASVRVRMIKSWKEKKNVRRGRLL